MKRLSASLLQFNRREMIRTSRLLMLGIVSVWLCTIAVSQDDSKQGLARPEWQLRADLEFRMACQSAIQKLCLELAQTYRQNPNAPTNSQLLSDMELLLAVMDGKIPTSLPQHPATVEYVNKRKAAVIEWNKVYKSKGRDLPNTALEAERKFQEANRSPTAGSLAHPNSKVESKTPTSSIDADELDRTSVSALDDEANGTDKKLEKKPMELTVKNAVSLIRDVQRLLSSNPSGETTAERQASSLALKKAANGVVEKQPDCLLTFPIKDVASRDNGLEFKVDNPVEFEQIQNELGPDLVLSSNTQAIHTTIPSIIKKWKSIKPGDLLRIRMKLGVTGLTTGLSNKHQIEFSVSCSQQLDGKKSDLKIVFIEKSILDMQISKLTAKTGGQ